MNTILKYPRTPHIEGSRYQPGDEDMDSVRFSTIANRFIVVEEKVDGANCGVSFSPDGELLLQSRGHYLTGGYREKHFNLFKTWANAHENEFWDMLTDRYILYGEWLYAKHTVFYDQLPHYFMEFDIYDKVEAKFLSTAMRRRILNNYPFIVSVLVLFEGKMHQQKDLAGLLGPSNFISGTAVEKLKAVCSRRGLDVTQVLHETNVESLMEGLYIKVEEDGAVKERYKYVRASFLTKILDSESHWLNRPIIPNMLKDGLDLFTI
ncbi:MAG: ATP-dependent ligase [Firmicutes bacterium]|nr:ATP-dependent ligase [Bacillota bacterium]